MPSTKKGQNQILHKMKYASNETNSDRIEDNGIRVRLWRWTEESGKEPVASTGSHVGLKPSICLHTKQEGIRYATSLHKYK